jgi:hypothetical protein
MQAGAVVEVVEHKPDQIAQRAVESVLYLVLGSLIEGKYLPSSFWTRDHRLPFYAWISYMRRSYHSAQSPLLRLGSTKLVHLSRHSASLLLKPRALNSSAILFHFLELNSGKRARRSAISWVGAGVPQATTLIFFWLSATALIEYNIRKSNDIYQLFLNIIA